MAGDSDLPLTVPLLRAVNDTTNSLAAVQSVAFHCTALPLINKLLVKVELTLLNELSLDFETHTMHVPLSPDSVVCGLSIETAEGWAEACTVPVDVPYHPKAARSSAAAATSPHPVWCATVVLPFQQPRGVRVTYAADLEVRNLHSWAYRLPFSFHSATDVHGTRVDCYPEGAFSAKPLLSPLADPILQQFTIAIDALSRVPQSAPRSVVAHQHFVTFIPQAAIEALLPLQLAELGEQHLLLIFDISLSCCQRWSPEDCSQFLETLEAEYVKVGCSSVTYTMARFSQKGAPVVQKGTRADVVTAVAAMAYEGGTDMRAIDSILSAVQAVDAIVVFSDGLDSLGDGSLNVPRVMTTNAPVYTVLPADGGDPARSPNRHFLEWLATKRGGLCLPLGLPLATAIVRTRSRTFAISIKVAQSPKPEVNSHFETVPDWKEPQFWWPSRDSGLELSGTVPTHCPQISITLRRGPHLAEMPLVLPPEDSPAPDVMRLVSVTHAALHNKYLLRSVASLGVCAGQIVRCCKRYRIAGDFTTLKLLPTIEERLEYNQPFRDTDPNYSAWLEAKKQRDQNLKEVTAKLSTRRIREAHALNARNCKVLQSVDSSLLRTFMNAADLDAAARAPKAAAATTTPKRKPSALGNLLGLFGNNSGAGEKTAPPAPAQPPRPAAQPVAVSREASLQLPTGPLQAGPAQEGPPPEAVEAAGLVAQAQEEQRRALEVKLRRKLSQLSANPSLQLSDYNAPFGDDPDSPFMEAAAAGDWPADTPKPAEGSGDVSRSSSGGSAEDHSRSGPRKSGKSTGTSSAGPVEATAPGEEEMPIATSPTSRLEPVSSTGYAMPKRTFSRFETSSIVEGPGGEVLAESGRTESFSSPKTNQSEDTDRRSRLLGLIKQRQGSVTAPTSGPAKGQKAESSSGSESDEDSNSDSGSDDRDADGGAVGRHNRRDGPREASQPYLTPLLAYWHAHQSRLKARPPFQTFGLRHMHAATKLVLDRLGRAVNKSPESFNWAAEFFFSTYHQYQDNPGYYLYVAEMFRDAGAPASLCERIAMCVLEVCEPYITTATLENRNPARRVPEAGEVTACSETARVAAQVLRSVGYFLLGINQIENAVQVLSTLLHVAPGEPQSHLDVALACFLLARQQTKKEAMDPKVLQARTLFIFKHLATVLMGTWHKGWGEIEWPAMLLLTWVAQWAEAQGLANAWQYTGLHPCVRVPFLPVDLLVWCSWDTANTVVDLSITEPNEQEVNVHQPYSSFNPAFLSNEGRSGFGPTCYLSVKAKPGTYKVAVQHHTRDKDSLITGPTRVLVMAAQYMGDKARDRLNVRFMRLPSDQQTTPVIFVPIQ